jgi:hypothetical protein
MVDPRLSPRDEKALQDLIDRGLLPGHKIEGGRIVCPRQDEHGRRYVTEEEQTAQRERILKLKFDDD